MAKNRQTKQKHATRKGRKFSWKIAEDKSSHTTDDEEFSVRLSHVLDKYAVNGHLIKFRRKIMFSSEREITLMYNALGFNRRMYYFGSEIEVTSTLGMRSDQDSLHRFDSFRLFLDSENPPLQQHDHKVVIKVSTDGCASQHCTLTMIEPSTQAKLFEPLDPIRDPREIIDFFQGDWITTDGRIPHTIMFECDKQPPLIRKHTHRHGPAECIQTLDKVNAYYCKSLPPQCKFVFERPRPGHWPPEKTLNKAKKDGVFIVPQGPPKSTNICTNDYFNFQWRLSTNLAERLFMFSLDTVHLKAYVLTKMIRKELFMPEYRDRLSTFHFKTAFFFAVENTRPDLWREDNLIHCVKYIFATLKRFLSCRTCPHFTIRNVNLFLGKIERHEFQKLVDKLTYVMYSLRIHIENIQMDTIGTKLNERRTSKNERCDYYTNGSALFKYAYKLCRVQLQYYFGYEVCETPVNERKALLENELTRLETYYCARLGKYRKYDYLLHGVMSNLATLYCSAYLEQKAEKYENKYNGCNKARQIYSQSLESNIIGNYMRYASFLFCNGEYDEACIYFDLIEKLIEEDKNTNLIYRFFVSPSELLAQQIAMQSSEQSFKQRWSVFLIFRRAEAMCVPEFLRCEIYRGRLGNFFQYGFWLGIYSDEDCISAQIEPYLYYLQYLTYRELRQETQQSEALMKLYIFTEIIKSTRFIAYNRDDFLSWGHFDTTLNMLGHCFELEQKLESAWKTYKTSLQMLPERNASVLHIIRLLWPVVQRLKT